MSKSSGNVVLVSDLSARGLDPLSLRLAFLQHRYRQQMNLTWEVIEGAQTTLTRWRSRVAQWANSPSAPLATDAVHLIVEAFNEDLDTPLALQQLRAVERDANLSDGAKFETFAHVDRLFGLDLTRDVGRPAAPTSLEVEGLLAERADARANKDWPGSDRLRDALAELGVVVVDTADGQQIG
jgi:cysteinyl-tRNA synthetase